MLANQIRRAIEAAPRVKLPDVAALLWRAYGAGQITEAEAEELSALIEAKKALPAPQKPVLVRRGSRPRSDASMERRRRWAASGRLPPALAARFTLAEAAVLAVIAVEVIQKKACTLAVGHIAALAGVSDSTVRNALREARKLGLITVEERRLTGWRNDTNVVAIVSPEWLSWLRLGTVRGGFKFVNRTSTESTSSKPKRLWGTSEGCRGAGSPDRQARFETLRRSRDEA